LAEQEIGPARREAHQELPERAFARLRKEEADPLCQRASRRRRVDDVHERIHRDAGFQADDYKFVPDLAAVLESKGGETRRQRGWSLIGIIEADNGDFCDALRRGVRRGTEE